MHDKHDLSALLGARLCHDLISPLGAVSNGVELLSMGPAGKNPEVALIAESIGSANARIRFFRVAYGTAKSDQRLGRTQILSIIGANLGGGRLRIDWTAEGDHPQREVKLAFLMLQCLETAMPYGGEIVIGRNAGGWQATGRAARLKLDAELWELLSNPAAPVVLTPAQVHFGLAPEEMRRQSRSLTADLRETEIRLAW